MIELLVGANAYAGWKRARVSRSIESVSGSFDLDVSDRWSSTAIWPITQGDQCTLTVDDTPVIVGYVDRRSLSYGPSEHTISLSGRDKTGLLVDCSVETKQWEFRNITVFDLAHRIAEPFGVDVRLQSGITLSKVPKISVDPGDTAFEAIERACRFSGLLPISDKGELLLTRPGSKIATTDLIEGKNIIGASADYDASGRYARYVVVGQIKGSNANNGAKSARVYGSATDPEVGRPERVLLVRPEGAVTPETANIRARWEASVRAARAASASVTVQGWTQSDGTVWPINALVRVRSPQLELNDQTMLIVSATYEISESGTTTTLDLKRPDAFNPEPITPKRKKKFSPWDELR